MVTILPALRQVREGLVELLDRTAVEQVCRELGYRWRDRQLDPYQVRWQVEVDLRDFKMTLGLDVLKGRKVETVLKELLVYVLVYNLVRLVTMTAARRQRVRPHRISFIDALRWLQPPKPLQALPELVVNPERPDRVEPRCLKRRPKQYPRMVRPRKELRKRLRKRRLAA